MLVRPIIPSTAVILAKYKILGFALQVRKGPDFSRRFGAFNVMTVAKMQCNEPGALTHVNYEERDEVQAQWHRRHARLDPNTTLMFTAIVLDHTNWYRINQTVQDCATLNECNSNPCGSHSNGCTDGVGQFFCDCITGYCGAQCEMGKKGSLGMEHKSVWVKRDVKIKQAYNVRLKRP